MTEISVIDVISLPIGDARRCGSYRAVARPHSCAARSTAAAELVVALLARFVLEKRTIARVMVMGVDVHAAMPRVVTAAPSGSFSERRFAERQSLTSKDRGR